MNNDKKGAIYGFLFIGLRCIIALLGHYLLLFSQKFDIGLFIVLVLSTLCFSCVPVLGDLSMYSSAFVLFFVFMNDKSCAPLCLIQESLLIIYHSYLFYPIRNERDKIKYLTLVGLIVSIILLLISLIRLLFF